MNLDVYVTHVCMKRVKVERVRGWQHKGFRSPCGSIKGNEKKVSRRNGDQEMIILQYEMNG